MRTKLSLLAVSSALALTAQAAMDFGNGVKVIPNATASVDFNDNLFLSSTNEQDETILRLTPGVFVSVGEGAVNTAQFSYNEQFQIYNDNDNLNTSLSLVDFVSRYDDGKMKFGIDAWWHEANQATRDIINQSSLIKRELAHAGVSDEVKFTEKTSGKIGIAYDSTDYNPAGYTDWKWWEIPVNYYYQVQPKLDLSLGFRYRSNEVGGSGVDSDELFYSVGVRGELSPKLTSEISAGYVQLKPDSGKDEGAFGLDGSLKLAVSPKTNLSVVASNRYGYSAQGDAYRIGGIGANFDTAITTAFIVKAGVAYNTFRYLASKRDDDFWVGTLAATYTLNEHVEFGASYNYSNNDSSLAAANFKNNIFSLSASLRY